MAVNYALLAEILRAIGLPVQVKTPDPDIAGVIAQPPVLLAGALAISFLLHASYRSRWCPIAARPYASSARR